MSASQVAEEEEPVVEDPPTRPPGWAYRGVTIFGREVWYASPEAQLAIVAVVCFLCPGMYNALTGLGGGGQIHPDAANHANTALYSTYAVVGFFSGTFANRLGLRLTLAIGAVGYAVYAASFLCFSHTANFGFVMFAGVLLGLCAGLLWTAQGAIVIAYPPESSKGRYISWFWVVFNLGAVLGSLIPLSLNIDSKNKSVADGTFITFIVLMLLGVFLALCICDASRIVRRDGSHVIMMEHPSWRSEFRGLYDTLANDVWIVLLFPLFFSSTTFYTYQLQDFNFAHFNLRTRSLNSLLYWLSQIIATIFVGYALDFSGIRRSVKARVSIFVQTAMLFAIWGGGWAWQSKQFQDRDVIEMDDSPYVKIDWTDGRERYIAPMILFMFYGAFDAVWQTCIYWYIGALSNSSRKAANITGFFKGLQSAGAGIWWRLDGTRRPYNLIFGVTWGILAAGMVFAAPVILFRIKDTTAIEQEDNKTDTDKAKSEGGSGAPTEKKTTTEIA